MNNLNNLETLTIDAKGKLSCTPGWMVSDIDDHYSHPSLLLPVIPKSNVLENCFEPNRFVVTTTPGHPTFLMRAMLKETIVDVPQEIVVIEGESVIIPAHKKTVLSWDFETEEYKRLVLILSPDYQVSFSKDFHILLDGEMKDFYLSGKYLKMFLVSVPNNGKILLKKNRFCISPVDFDF